MYLHSGALLIANAPSVSERPIAAENAQGETTWRSFIKAENAEDIIIAGRGTPDISSLYWGARNPVDFKYCSNVTVDGLTIINTANWKITMANCTDVDLKNIILLSTWRNSDGIAIVDCDGARVHDCFARSGDDLFKVKSMYKNSRVPCRNIEFRDCIAWADCCRGRG